MTDRVRSVKHLETTLVYQVEQNWKTSWCKARTKLGVDAECSISYNKT